MKVYVIHEFIYYPEDPETIIRGVVSSEEQADKICVQLQDSVKEFNEKSLLYKISYDYDEFELDDISWVDNRLKYNNNGRK